jgi:hypothetical protein
MGLKHQLNIHLDYGPTCPDGGLEIRYGYHYSGPHQLREQVICLKQSEIAGPLRKDLAEVYSALERRIPAPENVRLPHASIRPDVKSGGLTLVVLDQARAPTLPMARLYYYEIVASLNSRIEGQVRVERDGWTPTELEICVRIAEGVRKLAWQDYERLIGHHLFGENDGGA